MSLRICRAFEVLQFSKVKIMSELLVKERQLVLPGEILAKGLDYLPSGGTFRIGQEVKSKFLGLVRLKDKFLGVIPLAGVYVPKTGDGIVAVVSEIQSSFWIMDINSPYDAILPMSEATAEYIDTTETDLSSIYDIGDVVFIKVLNVSRSKHTSLTMNDYRAKKLIGGRLMRITPTKVPRVIGKEGTMVETIKNRTGCQIVVGQNGIVWLKGQKEALAAKTILTIEKEAHTSGLTDRIIKMLEQEGLSATEPAKNFEEEGKRENYRNTEEKTDNN